MIIRKLSKFFLPLLSCFYFCLTSHAEDLLQPAKIFSHNMVLQQGGEVPIWGKSNPNVKVTVEYAGQKKVTKADGNGKWSLNLEPMIAASNPNVLKVFTKSKEFRFNNVVVGEVWFSGGQSNMAYNAGGMAKHLELGKSLLDKADYPNIRFRRVNETNSSIPKEDLSGGSWFVCNKDSVKSFSAVGFIFSRRLHLELKIPIGVIDCSWGGTPIEPYIPSEAFKDHPTLDKLLSHAKARDFESIKKMRGGTFVRSDAWLAGAIYNSRVSPVSPYAIRGFTWYQAESNCGTGEDPRDYAHKMRALIRGWRKSWDNTNLPFYYVQLPQWHSYAWTYAREEQLRALDEPKTGMVVTVDLDFNNDIHPPNKIDVGERLALWPMKNEYNLSKPTSGPLFKSFEHKDEFIIVRFNHSKAGLMIGKSVVGDVLEDKGAKLFGFELADAHGVWHEAKASIENDSIILDKSGIEEPRAVRYACHPKAPKNKQWNLYNKSKLPASPFCSDWSLMKYDPTKNPMPK